MLVRLLGPVDVLADGVPRPVSGARRKAVLAVLGLSAGDVVSIDRLVDVVWEGQSSAIRPNTVQSHVSYLRRLLGRPDAIVARGPGYVLDLGAEATDLQVAVRLIEQSRQEQHLERQASRLREALALWRGQPLADVPPSSELAAEAERLTALRLKTVLSLVEARLGLGEHTELVPELSELVRQHPYREDVCRQLMLALYRGRRQAEALAAYQDLRRRLTDELGIDPSPALRDLEAAILRQDPAIDTPRAPTSEEQAPPPPTVDTAHPLPADTIVFTGRFQESQEIIDAAVATAALGRGTSVHAIDGMPGVGKTALAIHVAQRMAPRFADRPVFVDLHGYTAGRAPTDPADVLTGLLVADGLDPTRIPDDVKARAALWRQRVADRPTLMVLDNAASSGQVVPLLPGSAGSVVLVTSRRFLGDLPVDALTVPLDVLRPDDASRMFLRLAPRAVIDRDAVDELVVLCGYLPLAIALLARVLVRHRTWSVRDLLAETRARPITVTAEDRTVEAAFDLSYRNLPAERRRFFRCLGLHPGVKFDGYAAAALAGVPWLDAAGHLDALHADNLLVEAGYQRYTMHDLIRRYTRGLAGAGPAEENASALGRLVDYYGRTATAADARLSRLTRPTAGLDPAAAPATDTPDLADAVRALAWMRTERDNLFAAIAATDDPRQVVALTAGLAELLRRDGPWPVAIAAHGAAASAAERTGDRLGRANALTDLATAHRMSGEYRAGERAAQEALDSYRDLGNQQGIANALATLSSIWRMESAYPAAEQALEQAMAIYGELGDRLGEANALTYLGMVRYLVDQYAAAAHALREALSRYRDLGDRLGEAHALRFLGDVLRLTGDYPAAADTLHEALRLHRDLGDRLGEANTCTYLGGVHIQTGDYQAADQALKEALDLYRDLGEPLGQANALESLAQARLGSGNHPGALRAVQEALDLYRQLDHRLGQANALMGLGRVRLAIGDHQDARRALAEALKTFHELGDRSAAAETLSDLGTAYRHAGDLEAARKHHMAAVELAGQIDSQWNEAYAWAGVGRCDLAAGDAAAAVEHLRTALDIFRRIGAAEAAEVAAELAAAGAAPGPGEDGL